MTAQMSLLDLLDAELDPAERQQRDWTAWLQNAAGEWCCPACGGVEPTREALKVEHGWNTDLTTTGHPWFYSWPGRYEEHGSGNGGRCAKLRVQWLAAHGCPWPAEPVPYGTTFGAAPTTTKETP